MKFTPILAYNILQQRKSYEDLTIEDICILEEEQVFNGCGGKGGVSFDEILEMVERFEYFDNDLFEIFYTELKEQCRIHDYKYWIGGSWYHKFLADLVLSNWIFRKLQWTEWYIAPATWIGSMVGLTRNGNKYFNFT